MIRLQYHGTTSIPLEAEMITPDRLANLSAAEIAKLPIAHGNAEVPLGEFFTVTGDAGDREIRIEGDCSRVKRLGSEMQSGRLVIHGNAGMHLGARMSGGAIEVHGHVDDWAGAEMHGGLLHIHGQAGSLLGAGYRGARIGMRGGVILVEGDAGDEVGSVMRRGLIAVAGSIGAFAGVSMRAGSILSFGSVGARPGAGMKRGTLAFFGDHPELLPSFRESCQYEPMFLRLYLAELRRLGFRAAQVDHGISMQRYCGDLVSLGRGEILIAAL